jgi:hypothetical protein
MAWRCCDAAGQLLGALYCICALCTVVGDRFTKPARHLALIHPVHMLVLQHVLAGNLRHGPSLGMADVGVA